MLVEDKEKELAMMIVHGSEWDLDKVEHVFHRGAVLWIAEPMQRIARNGRCVIRMDLQKTMIEGHKLYSGMGVEPTVFGFAKQEQICSFCCEKLVGDSIVCCSTARYCSVKHQVRDSELGPSNFVCDVCDERIFSCPRYSSTTCAQFDCCKLCLTDDLEAEHQFVQVFGENH